MLPVAGTMSRGDRADGGVPRRAAEGVEAIVHLDAGAMRVCSRRRVT